MKIPPYLKIGDTVAIICTARKFFKEDAEPAIELLKSWGLNVKLGSTIGLDYYQLGGTDQERADDLQSQLDDINIKAIWIARGGYGTVRIIDKIDFTKFYENPKWIIGFSDITTLHAHLNFLNVASLHAIMPFTVPSAPDHVKETLKMAIFGKNLSYEFNSDLNNSIGNFSGEIIGGNLSIIYSLLGSKSAYNTNGKILFIEDLDEYLYHVDRMLQNLKRNHYFNDLKGIIVGGMTDMHDNQIPYGQNAHEIIKAIADEFNIPICFNFPAGHVLDNRSIYFGKQVQITITNKKVLFKYVD